ncbi:hypothetical protein [Marinagarivorans cellulosilyticus]|uniref:Uncharacterized protein n=1 Tax=Marinagarivorans cellulosilyticus TaxID=2721545 RepID=A0AAN1WHK1_9GAMM|nr:hypothetical protein [Marinagarivorans cellulosilyticus]BCD97694.1 hypothetical protein MARGE09_P1895 [Marinagarivorans cellulosilyticus]
MNYKPLKVFITPILTLMAAFIIAGALATLIGNLLATNHKEILSVLGELTGIGAGIATIIVAIYAGSAIKRWKQKSNENCLQLIWSARKNVAAIRDYARRDICPNDNNDVPERAEASDILFDRKGGFRNNRISRAVKNVIELEDNLMMLQAGANTPEIPKDWNDLHPGRHLLDEMIIVIEIQAKVNEYDLSEIVKRLGVEGDKDQRYYKGSSAGKINKIIDKVDTFLNDYEKNLF